MSKAGFFVFCIVLLLSRGAMAQDTSPLEVRISLSAGTALLGEPVWVNVRIANRSNHALLLSAGGACFNADPIAFNVPAAQPGRSVREPCVTNSGRTEGCYSLLPWRLEPGETLARAYVLEGNFRIAHPGTYLVLVSKLVRYDTAPPEETARPALDLRQEETATASLALNVLPSAPAQLLTTERALAQEATGTGAGAFASNAPAFTTPPASRVFGNDARHAAYDENLVHGSIAAGLAAYPAPGMEPVFGSWIASGTATTDAIDALYHLNTAAARVILARLAQSRMNPADPNFQSARSTAARDLGNMGDVSYVDALERLMEDGNRDVRRSAVLGLAQLGGAAALPFLHARAQNGASEADRADAIEAMGNTASLKAVPMLIDLLGVPDADQPTASEGALFTVTHYALPSSDAGLNLADTKNAWKSWWEQNKATAHAYGQFDCVFPLATPGSPPSTEGPPRRSSAVALGSPRRSTRMRRSRESRRFPTSSRSYAG